MVRMWSYAQPPSSNAMHVTAVALSVTPSKSALCKFQRCPPNPHRNDLKVPTRHLRAGGKRSNNITQQSSMGPTEQIYIQHDSMSQEYRYTEQRSNHLENNRASS